MTAATVGRRVEAWYRCRVCHVKRHGDDGKLCCDECGGPVNRIGYRVTPAPTTRGRSGG